jgi:hypothetical protein
VYQVEISVADVTAAGYDNSDGTSGITTICVKHGTYTWSCRPLADPGKDCGNSAGESPIFALERAKISCPRRHHFNAPIEYLTLPEQPTATTASASPPPAPTVQSAPPHARREGERP